MMAFSVYQRHRHLGSIALGGDDERAATATFDRYEDAAACAQSNVGGSVHGVIEIHCGDEPGETTLIAVVTWTASGAAWDAGPAGQATEDPLLPVRPASPLGADG